jgi:hypothetical protein
VIALSENDLSDAEIMAAFEAFKVQVRDDITKALDERMSALQVRDMAADINAYAEAIEDMDKRLRTLERAHKVSFCDRLRHIRGR